MSSSLFRALRLLVAFLWVPTIILLIIGIIIITGFLAIEPLFMAKSIAYIEDFFATGTFKTDEFLWFLWLWGAYIIVSVILTYIHRYYIADKTALAFHNHIATKYAGNVYNMSMGSYLTKKTGSIYKNFDRGASTHFEWVFFLLKDAIKITFSLVCVLVILLFTSWQMTLLALSMVPFMALSGWWIFKKTVGPQTENFERWNAAFGYIGDFMNNIQLGKILRLESLFLQRFFTEISDALDKQLYTSKWWSVNDMITSVFVMISRFLVLGYGVYAIANGTMSLSALMLVFSLTGMIYYPLGYLFGSFGSVQKFSTSLDTFYTEFVDNIDREAQDSGKVLHATTGKIAYENVSFHYHDNRPILKNLSFRVAPGERIALVGNTGAGKSTILALLMRFWEPNSGRITLDGTDISEYSRASLRAHLGLVAQDSSLFNLSIRENLLFAKSNATEDEIKDALTKASADFVFSLENGLDTIIGERGLKLSGGEKQRIAIARLFLQNPEIIILDEATSALDNVTEKKIQASLENLLQGRTAIIIAHRLSTIQNVDRILYIENGEVTEEGNYQELIAKNGKFARLANPEHLIIS